MSIRSILQAMRPHHLSSGFIAVLIGYTCSVAIICQAATNAGASHIELGSWLTALGLGIGLTTIGLSCYYRMPILTAWSTPGAALLITSINGVPMNEVIGAFLCSSLLLAVCGFSGLFARIMRCLPLSLANAMLAGVLLHFGLDLFHVLQQQPLLVGTMLLGFLLLKSCLPRYALLLVLLLGMGIGWQQGLMQMNGFEISPIQLQWTTPSLSFRSLFSVALPLFLITMSTQNLPGIGVLRAHGYQPAVSPIIGWTGLTGLLLAPFGCYALNLAAITAALCMGKEADPEPSGRYLATCCAGVIFLLTGLLGATVATLFTMLPQALIMTIAGLGLLSILGNSLHQAIQTDGEREAAMLTFLVTASGLNYWGIGAAFWGLLAGGLTLSIQTGGWRIPWRQVRGLS